MGVSKYCLGKYLRRARKRLKLTLREVEKLSGVSNSHLSQLERDIKKNPHPRTLRKLGRVYGLSMKSLMDACCYLDNEPEPVFTEEQINEAFDFMILDNEDDFNFLSEKEEKLTPEIKKMMVKIYEETTGKRVLESTLNI